MKNKFLGGIQMKSKRITKESLMKGIKKITKHKLFKNKWNNVREWNIV